MAVLKNKPSPCVQKLDEPTLSKSNSSYKFLVSACLAGVNCTYIGKNNLKKSIRGLVEGNEAIAVCPEVLGGLPTPREDAEIVGGDGEDVLKKKAKVMTTLGKDVSKNFINGAKNILHMAKKHKIEQAILKSKSPSCGFGRIYDGTFKKALKKGDGVLTAILRRNGIKVYTEKDDLHV